MEIISRKETESLSNASLSMNCGQCSGRSKPKQHKGQQSFTSSVGPFLVCAH